MPLLNECILFLLLLSLSLEEKKNKPVNGSLRPPPPSPRSALPLCSPDALPPVQDREGSSSGMLSKEKLAISGQDSGTNGGARVSGKREREGRDRLPQRQSERATTEEPVVSTPLLKTPLKVTALALLLTLARIEFYLGASVEGRREFAEETCGSGRRKTKKGSSAPQGDPTFFFLTGAIAAARFPPRGAKQLFDLRL